MAIDRSGSQAVFVALDGEAARVASQRGEPLRSLEAELGRVLAASGAGALSASGPDTDGGFVIAIEGESAERLFRAVAATLERSALCGGARVGVRPGGPHTPARVFRLQPHPAAR